MKSYSIVFSFSLLCNGIEYYGWIIYQAAVSSRTLELKKLCTNQNSHMYESKETLWVLKKCKCRIRKGELCLFTWWWWWYKFASLTNDCANSEKAWKPFVTQLQPNLNLSSSDFWHLPKLKLTLKGQHSPCAEWKNKNICHISKPSSWVRC